MQSAQKSTEKGKQERELQEAERVRRNEQRSRNLKIDRASLERVPWESTWRSRDESGMAQERVMKRKSREERKGEKKMEKRR